MQEIHGLKHEQGKLRLELKEVFINDQHTLQDMATHIGIAPASLSRFLNGVDLNITPLLRIEKWLKERERNETSPR